MNKPSKEPTGFCNALFPCELCRGLLCFSSSNCQNRQTHFSDGTHVFDECNKDTLVIDKVYFKNDWKE